MDEQSVTLQAITVGALSENCYVVSDPTAHECVVVDPGDEPERILSLLEQLRVLAIVLTHGHQDHTGAVLQLHAATGAPVLIHPADVPMLGQIKANGWLQDGQALTLGQHTLQIVHTPGHTPGQVSLLIGAQALVGDTIFAGGPGRTWSANDFRTTLITLTGRVLQWPDDTICHPGHGTPFRLGDIRAEIERFVARQHLHDFWGDAEWSR